jgi:hypothetical protein
MIVVVERQTDKGVVIELEKGVFRIICMKVRVLGCHTKGLGLRVLVPVYCLYKFISTKFVFRTKMNYFILITG